MKLHLGARHRAAHRSQRRIWMLTALIALFVALTAPLAHADPSPGATQKTPPLVTSSCSDQQGQSPSAPPDAPTGAKSGGTNDGLLDPFDFRDCNGVPISAYSVKTDTGGWTDIDLKLWNIIAMLFFGIAKWAIGFACWLIDWALNFGLAKIMVGPIDRISNTIKVQLIDQLTLPGLFSMFAGLYAGWHILFRQRARGFAEAGVSLVIAALATTVLVSPPQVLLGQNGQPAPKGSTMLLSQCGLLGKTKAFSLAIASIVLNNHRSSTSAECDAPAENVAAPITTALVDAFIVKPNELMLYGQTFSGDCAKAYATYKQREYDLSEYAGGDYWTAASQDSLYGTHFLQQLIDANKKFTDACKTQSPKAKRASADLAFSAAFIAIAAIIVCILMVLVTGGFLTAQGWMAFEAIKGHWALCAGILPGGGRAALWRWCSAIVKAVLAVMLSILFLCIFILIILALMDSDTGNVLAVKFIVIDIASVAALAGHKKIRETAQNVAVNLNKRLANARVAGSSKSVFNNPSRYGETAPGLKQLASDARSEFNKVATPVGRGLKGARDMWVGSPQGAKKGNKIRAAARLATTAAAAVGTGGAAAAAKVGAQQAAKQALRKRLAEAAANKMSQTRGGRATMATGKAAVVAGKYGWKATKFTALATVGAPVGIPRGIAATKKGAAAAQGRANEVKKNLTAVKDRTTQRIDEKVEGARAFGNEYRRNLSTAGRFVGRHAANFQLGMTQAVNPQASANPPGPRTSTSAPRVPGRRIPEPTEDPGDELDKS